MARRRSPSGVPPGSRVAWAQGKTAGLLDLTLNGAANGNAANGISWQWQDVNGNDLHDGSVDCGSVGILTDVGLSFSGSAPIQPDLTFSFSFNGPLTTSSDSVITNVSTSYSVSGKLDTAGNATGTLNLNRFSFDYQGTHYDCAAAGYGWQAKVGA